MSKRKMIKIKIQQKFGFQLLNITSTDLMFLFLYFYNLTEKFEPATSLLSGDNADHCAETIYNPRFLQFYSNSSIPRYTDFFNSRLFPISESPKLEKASISLSLTKRLFRFSDGSQVRFGINEPPLLNQKNLSQ